jgi:uncharacterized protein with HEPN domain
MLEAVRLAREYVAGISKDDFLEDRRTQQAVVLNLITIGEAASRIVTDLKGDPRFNQGGMRCADS